MTVFDGIRDDWRGSAAQSDWQPDRDDYQPEWWSIHWGGGRGVYPQATHTDAKGVLNGWWKYHTQTQGWSDIAYNYASSAQDSTVAYRLRGERPNGAQSNSNEWGPRTRTFVFYDGPNSPFPTDTQLRSFALLWQQDPLPVRFHRDFPDQWTDCPGDELVAWIRREGWKDYLMSDKTVRLGGANRYATAALVADFDWQFGDVIIVTGENWPDAAAAAGAPAVPILFVRGDTVPAETAGWLSANKPTRAVIVGGHSSVGVSVETEINRLIQ